MHLFKHPIQIVFAVVVMGLIPSGQCRGDDQTHDLSASRPVAEVAAMVGNGTVTRSGATPVPLAVGMALYERDILKTVEATKVKIRFAEDSMVTMGPMSTLALVKTRVRLAEGDRQITLSMTGGVVRAVVQLHGMQDVFTFRTPTAQATVRGTEFGVSLKPDSAGVFVKQGKVVVTNRDPEVSGEVVLTDAEGTDVAVGEAPTPPKKWGAPRVNALLEATTIPEPPAP